METNVHSSFFSIIFLSLLLEGTLEHCGYLMRKLSWGLQHKTHCFEATQSSFFTNIFPSVGNLDSESQSMARPMMLPEF